MTNPSFRLSTVGLWLACLMLASDAAGASTLFPPDSTPRHFGGPDSAGYCWIDSDTVGGPQFDWIDTAGFSLAPNLGDEYRINIPVYFDFPYYDSTYNYVYVSANGWLAAGHANPGGTGDSTPRRLPDSPAPNNIICPYWDNLAVGPGFGGGRLYYRNFGTAPNRYFVLVFQDVNRVGTDTTDLLTFEVIIHEDGTVIFQYADVTTGDSMRDYGRSASVGIENRSGTTGLQYVRGHPDSSVNWPGNKLAAGKAIRFWKRDPGIAEQVGRPDDGFALAVEPSVATGASHVRYTQPRDLHATLALYDALGRTVMQRRVQGSGRLRLTPAGPGVYHCALTSAKGNCASTLVIVD